MIEASMENSPPETPDLRLRGPRFWTLLVVWLIAISVMSVYSVRKAFNWAGDVNKYQQEQSKEFGPGSGAGEADTPAEQ